MVLILTLIKLSLLTWYWSIFSVHDGFRPMTLVVGTLVLLWGTVSVFIFLFQCMPISAAWDMAIVQTARCSSMGRLVVGFEVPNIALDLAILGLPIRMVVGLMMDRARKVMVGCVFGLGGL
jgi:hypothetical protein